MNKLIIKDMTTSDIDAVDDMRQLSWVDSYINEEFGVSADLINDYFAYRRKKQNKQDKINKIKDSISDPNKYCKVAKDEDGKVVGFIFGEKTSPTQSSLGALYLEPSLIGKGNGKLLMDGFMKWLGEGVECELFVVCYNIRAINFYKKYGFVIVSNKPAQESHLDASHPLVSKMLVIRMVRKAE
jgi:ribosomal protein S18 acetylase RimI-like enzyme